MSEQIQDEKLQPGLHIDQEVDLLEFLHAILRVKYRILVLSILIAGAVFGASKLVENKFKATVLVAVNISEGFGGTKPGQYRGSDVVGLLEYSFMVDEPAENELDRVMARLGSSTFIELFIDIFNPTMVGLHINGIDGRAVFISISNFQMAGQSNRIELLVGSKARRNIRC